MKYFLIKVEEIDIPVSNFIDGGWYAGRQFYNGVFGEIGAILEEGLGEYKIMNDSKKNELIKLLKKHMVFKFKK